jgi:hypothetical protein
VKLRSLGMVASLALLAALPSVSLAVPTTWTYTGTCSVGDCDVVPSISGTLTGDPELFGPPDELNQFILGDINSYTFQFGGYELSGFAGFGTYVLDAAGNIIGGSMSFGDIFKLEFLDVGSATWTFLDENLFQRDVRASGTGGYAKAGGGTPVPEPGVLSLLGLGLLAFGLTRRRRA